jgi:hypothetical protein
MDILLGALHMPAEVRNRLLGRERVGGGGGEQ